MKKFKRGKAIIHKCENEGCKNQVKTNTSRLAQGAGRYCSRECAFACKPKHRYPPETIAWLEEHVGIVPFTQIAEMIGTTVGGLKRSLTEMRHKGYKIHKARPASPIGTIRADRIKTEDGWKRIPKPPVERKPKQEPNRLPRPKSISIVPTEDKPIERTRLIKQGGGYIECDSDKVDKVLKYLQKCG